MYTTFLKPILFKLGPETAHRITLFAFRIFLLLPGFGWLIDRFFLNNNPQFERQLMGLTFKNCVGLAAGFDKNASSITLMARLGFGHIEIGTVTPLAQAGNEQPRLFRLPMDNALINRMGFNNLGVDKVVQNLRMKNVIAARKKYRLIIGGNIGKNKLTSNENAWKDYLHCFEQLFPYVDYFVINVSSPNTPGLRELQEKEPLTNIIQQLNACNAKQLIQKPILLKIAPDLTGGQIDDIIAIAKATNLSGIIATNTTVERINLKTPQKKLQQIGNGGLSGQPLTTSANDILWQLRRALGSEFLLIGVGGIMQAEDVQEKVNRGASLVQIYTGLVFKGPSIVKDILARL